MIATTMYLYLFSFISCSRLRRSLSRLRNITHRRTRTATETPTVTHFSVTEISVLRGKRIIYITAVYIAKIATVTFGFLKNLMTVN